MMRIVRRVGRHGTTLGAAVAAFMIVAAPCVAALPSTSTPVSTEIIPGRSIGPARLGMTVDEATAALGPSMEVREGRRWYPRFNVAVDFDAGVAVRITTISAKYRTPGGAGVGTADTEAARLVGRVNSVTTMTGGETVVLYMFDGVGFVFRGGRAIESFVTAAMPFGESRGSTIVPVAPQGAPVVIQSGPSSSGSAGKLAAALLRDITATVLPAGGLAVSGTAANVGSVPIGPLVVTATFTRASGDEVDRRVTIEAPIAPGDSAPFTIEAAMVLDVIVRYRLSVTSATGAVVAGAAGAVPTSAYGEFALRQIHIRVDLGAPFQMTGPPRVQALVSVADTGAIPALWVQQVTVSLPYVNNGQSGSATVQLSPGQTETVLVPAGATLGAPQVTAVALNVQ